MPSTRTGGRCRSNTAAYYSANLQVRHLQRGTPLVAPASSLRPFRPSRCRSMPRGASAPGDHAARHRGVVPHRQRCLPLLALGFRPRCHLLPRRIDFIEAFGHIRLNMTEKFQHGVGSRSFGRGRFAHQPTPQDRWLGPTDPRLPPTRVTDQGSGNGQQRCGYVVGRCVSCDCRLLNPFAPFRPEHRKRQEGRRRDVAVQDVGCDRRQRRRGRSDIRIAIAWFHDGARQSGSISRAM